MLDLVKLSKPVAVLLAIGLLFAIGGVGFWRGTARLDSMTDKAVANAKATQDALWKAQLAKSDVEVANARAANAILSAAAAAKAAEAQARAAVAEKELEERNASLPNPGRIGLDRDRWRLLNPPQ